MTDLDLERLGDLWREEPDPKAIAELLRAAGAARRRALAGLLFDYALAALLLAACVTIIAVNPKLEVIAVGVLAIVLLVTSQVRQLQSRRLELKGLTGDTEKMLDQSIAQVEARVKQARSGLILFVPAFLVGLAFAAVSEDSRTSAFIFPALGHPLPHVMLMLLAVIVGGTLMVHLALTIRRGRREHARLLELRHSYGQEHEKTVSEGE